MKYSYQAEKFSVARRALMLPHTRGVSESVAAAFIECSYGLDNLSEDGLDDDANHWLRKLRDFMDTSKVSDPTGRGTFSVKADNFSDDDLIEISRLIGDLATWFDNADR